MLFMSNLIKKAVKLLFINKKLVINVVVNVFKFVIFEIKAVKCFYCKASNHKLL